MAASCQTCSSLSVLYRSLWMIANTVGGDGAGVPCPRLGVGMSSALRRARQRGSGPLPGGSYAAALDHRHAAKTGNESDRRVVDLPSAREKREPIFAPAIRPSSKRAASPKSESG